MPPLQKAGSGFQSSSVWLSCCKPAGLQCISLPPGGLSRNPVQRGKRRNLCRHSSHLAQNVRHIALSDSSDKKLQLPGWQQQKSVPDVYEQPLKAGIDRLPCLVGWFGTLAAGSSNADIASGYTGPRRSWIGAAAEATPS
jgi:hypothetical protein